MDQATRELFEEREAVQYLIEDNELACIELNVQRKTFERLVGLNDKYAGIRGTEAPSVIVAHLSEILRRKYLVEVAFIRETTNRSFLRSKARASWQK